jgi:phosphate starvation-inducible protein PhoH and related proteins
MTADPTSVTEVVVIPSSVPMVNLLGPADAHVRLIESSLGVHVHVRGNRVTLSGEPAALDVATRCISELVQLLRIVGGDRGAGPHSAQLRSPGAAG